jgi:glutamate formiminotransferase/formiminotetrahydrofolate cyclodeaminase
MTDAMVECVPNFSEGQNKDVINQITDTIKMVDHVTLLDVDPGFEMNRTVVTFIGPPDAVKEAAFQAIKKQSKRCGRIRCYFFQVSIGRALIKS